MPWVISDAMMNACGNSRSLRGQEAESLEGTCSDGEPSVQSNGNHTQLAYLQPDRMTAFSRLSRFGMTFKPLTADSGEDLLTSYRAAFHVRTSASQDQARVLTASDQACGSTWRGSLAKYDPDSSSWKTAQLSLLGDSEPSSVTWPRSGMTVGGQLWELPMLGRRIKETESGYWPTPTASAMPCEGTQRIMRNKWLNGELSLEEASAIAGRDVRKAQGKVPAHVLRWPTPTVCGNYNRKGALATSGDGLATAVQKWPTPTAHMAKETNAPSEAMRNEPSLTSLVGGSLNPTWTEWLMGWPLGHTDLKPLGMDKFQQWQQQHSTF